MKKFVAIIAAVFAVIVTVLLVKNMGTAANADTLILLKFMILFIL